MGKILKYCGSCDEGFAEKFGFCPNCGATLQAFEMNPLTGESEAPATLEAAAEPPAPAFIAEPAEAATPEIKASAPDEDLLEIEAAPPQEAEVYDEPAAETPEIGEPMAEEAIPAAAAPVFYQTSPMYADAKPASFEDAHSQAQKEGEYYLTVIEEKNVGTRNGLLGGAAVLMVGILLTGLVVNIFSHDLDIGSINDDIFNAVLVDDIPAVVEDTPQEKKDKDAGGGGGGGRQQDETTQGDLANQTKNPQRAPEAVPRMENPSLVLPPASTQGNKTFEQTHDRFGDPNGRFTNWNNGTGSGGGQGSGTGTGQGSGRGTGAGSGIGSGYGSGNGNGNGNGTGDGDDGNGAPPRAVGVTQGIKIISKPRPGYTDTARQQNIQGTVILRVTFLANGSIGGVSAVKGLGSGLTEQAIAAAKRISFEPAKINGVAQSVTKQIEYSFSIY
ncbi:MAG TPA: energy transducer TonB [Pyrinomonadaceae bacterium]|jgi:protein TonB|nr:energy transducer TonB [Pyrinomonadaceae bacterium]